MSKKERNKQMKEGRKKNILYYDCQTVSRSLSKSSCREGWVQRPLCLGFCANEPDVFHTPEDIFRVKII
jgi:hypothetical protein